MEAEGVRFELTKPFGLPLFKTLHKAAHPFADVAHPGVPQIVSKSCTSIKMIPMLSMSLLEQKSGRGAKRNISETEPNRSSLVTTVQMSDSRQALIPIEAASMVAFIVMPGQHTSISVFPPDLISNVRSWIK